MKKKISIHADSGIDARDLLPAGKLVYPGVQPLDPLPLSNSGHSPSTMRVMAVISLLVGAIIAVVGLFVVDAGKDLTGLAVLCSVFVAPAFAGKAMQKHIEMKGRKSE